MANFDIIMPKMGESIEEATITNWFVKEGDTVQEDDVLLADPELRQRMRYVDLAHTDGVMERFDVILGVGEKNFDSDPRLAFAPHRRHPCFHRRRQYPW